MKEDAGWGGSASFASKSFDFIHWFRCEDSFKGSPGIKSTFLACLKVLLWFVFSIYGLFIFMVNWREAYSEPSKTSNVGHFPKLVNNWMPLICFTKNSVLDVWKGSEYVLTAWKVNCKVYIATRHPLSEPYIRPTTTLTKRFFWEINFPSLLQNFYR